MTATPFQSAIQPAQSKSKKRIADHGEVFTREREVKAMLDLVKSQSQFIETRFLEPACGTGNFLAEILTRKLQTVLIKSQSNKSQKSPQYSQTLYERNAIYAISSIYGIELLADNVSECRNRLLALFQSHCQTHIKHINPEVIDVAQFLLSKNIVHGDALTLKDGQGRAIVFSGWEFVGDFLLNRHDFVYENLVEKTDNAAPIDKAFIPKEITHCERVHYLQINKQQHQPHNGQN